MDSSWKIAYAVAIGGAIGSVCRLAVGQLLNVSGPLSTFLVNIAGSFVLGMLAGYELERGIRQWLKRGIGTGFCGGLTTMSALSKETFQYIEQGSILMFFVYSVGSVCMGLFFCFVGLQVGRKVGMVKSIW